jgi:hypothetical protein
MLGIGRLNLLLLFGAVVPNVIERHSHNAPVLRPLDHKTSDNLRDAKQRSKRHPERPLADVEAR